jgi:hypothetical protein
MAIAIDCVSCNLTANSSTKTLTTQTKSQFLRNDVIQLYGRIKKIKESDNNAKFRSINWHVAISALENRQNSQHDTTLEKTV